ncbi:hypothetical protein BJX99DRAFT_247966 [Aspergillus californicus]
MDREKDGLITRASSVTISEELPKNIPVDIDNIINNLLVLIQVPAKPPLKKTQQIEEALDRLGPPKISSHVLCVIGSLHDFTVALVQCTGLKQLCLFQGPDRDNDNASASDPNAQVFPMVYMFCFVDYQGEDNAKGFAIQFLAYLWSLRLGLDPEKAILRFAHKVSSSSSPGHSSISPIPAGFFDYNLPPNDPSRVRLGDLQPGSWVVLEDSSAQICNYEIVEKRRPEGPEAYPPPPPPLAKSFLNLASANLSDPTQPSAGTDQQGCISNSSDNNTIVANNSPFLYYSFVKIPHISADIDIAHEKQQQRSLPITNPPEVVGRLTDFLQKQVEEVERDIHTGQASVGFGTGNCSINISVMAESRARALLDQLM